MPFENPVILTFHKVWSCDSLLRKWKTGIQEAVD